MKKLYIIAISVGIAFGIFIVYNSLKEVELRYESYQHWDDYIYAENTYSEIRKLSYKSSLSSLSFIAFYLVIFSLTFRFVKTNTSKVINILGVSFSGIVILVTLLPVVDPGKISYEELSYLLIPYLMAVLTFCVVNYIQITKLDKSQIRFNDQTIDDII